MLTPKDLHDRENELMNQVMYNFKKGIQDKVLQSECMAIRESIAGARLRDFLQAAVRNQEYLTAQGIKNAMDWIAQRNKNEESII